MENQLLRKSGLIAVIITFAAIAFWFGFSKISTGAYNEKNLTKQFLAEDSKVFKTIVVEVGSDTVARIVAGTSSMSLTGTSSYPTQPRIEFDGATGLWSFKNTGPGTQTTVFGTLTAAFMDANYINKIVGAGSNTTLENSNLTGVGTISASLRISGTPTFTGNIIANSQTITPTEFGYIGSLTSDAQTQIDGKRSTAVAIMIGTDTTGSTSNLTEGTNLYYTDARVNTAVGSLSINALSDVNTSGATDTQFLKLVGGVWQGAPNSVTVSFPDVTGSITSSQFPANPSFVGTLSAINIVTIGTTTRSGSNILTVSGSASVNALSVTGTITAANIILGTTSTNYTGILNVIYSSAGTTSVPAGGIATADNEAGGVAANAIDNNEATFWQGTTALPHWWKYDYGAAKQIHVDQLMLEAYHSGSGRQDKDFNLQGSNDDSAWDTLHTAQEVDEAGYHTYSIGSVTAYRYFKLNFTSTWHTSGTNVAIIELRLIGKDIINNTLITTSHNGVLLGTTTATASSGSSTLYIATNDNRVGITALINATQANITTNDTFISFRSVSGEEGSIAGTAVAGVIAYNTTSITHRTWIEDRTGLQILDVLEMKGTPIGNWKGLKRSEYIQEQVDVLDATGMPITEKIGTKTVQKRETVYKAIDKLYDVKGTAPKEQLVTSGICKTRGSKQAWGVYCGTDNNGVDYVMSFGTGFVTVVNTGENIEIGDYLMSSDYQGKCELQYVTMRNNRMNYTLAKSAVPVIWEAGEQWRQIPCLLVGD